MCVCFLSNTNSIIIYRGKDTKHILCIFLLFRTYHKINLHCWSEVQYVLCGLDKILGIIHKYTPLFLVLGKYKPELVFSLESKNTGRLSTVYFYFPTCVICVCHKYCIILIAVCHYDCTLQLKCLYLLILYHLLVHPMCTSVSLEYFAHTVFLDHAFSPAKCDPPHLCVTLEYPWLILFI